MGLYEIQESMGHPQMPPGSRFQTAQRENGGLNVGKIEFSVLEFVCVLLTSYIGLCMLYGQ